MTIKMEDIIEEVTTSVTPEEAEAEAAAIAAAEATQDPLKEELERVQKKGKTELEKALYTRTQIDKRIEELGGAPTAQAAETVPKDDDDTPVTVGMLRKLQQESATKTALQLAEDIQDPTERELVKHHVEHSIRPTGNPAEDLSLARAIVNASKNRQVIEEISRKTDPKTHSSASSAPAIFEKPLPELTPEELKFTKAPFNMTVDQILKTRRQ